MVKVKFIKKSQWHLEAELIDANPVLPTVSKDYFKGDLKKQIKKEN